VNCVGCTEAIDTADFLGDSYDYFRSKQEVSECYRDWIKDALDREERGDIDSWAVKDLIRECIKSYMAAKKLSDNEMVVCNGSEDKTFVGAYPIYSMKISDDNEERIIGVMYLD
jgi:hypothetical protein